MSSSDPAPDLGPAPPAAAPAAGVSLHFNLGKIPDQGEDSDPILRAGPDLALLAALDGMGGAGGTSYDVPGGPRTGAYIASRVAREVVEDEMLELLTPNWRFDGQAAAQRLHVKVTDALQARLEELKAPKSGLRSRLLRALPTTMALLALQRAAAGEAIFDVDVLWAGDSRAYLFDPTAGASQVTTDDIKSGADAMTNLTEDSVMSNTMSADTPFHISVRTLQMTAPFLAVCATDGCYGYIPSPMHFEHLVLSTLQQAVDADAWRDALVERVSAVAGDDAAMAVLGVGIDFDEAKKLFAERTALLEERYIAPLDAATAKERQAEQELAELRARKSELVAELWGAYRPVYEAQREAPTYKEGGA